MNSYLGDDRPIAEITRLLLQEFLAAQDSVGAKTLLNYHTGLSALWRWAAGEGLVKHNIVREIKRPRPEKRAIEPYSEGDVQAMLQGLGRSLPYKRPRDGSRTSHGIAEAVVVRNRAIVLLLLDTGLRASELCGLRVGDVDLRNRKVKVLGKGSKERILRFSATTGTALWRYLASKEKDGKAPGRPLFTTIDDRPLTRDNLYHRVQKIGERAGVAMANVPPVPAHVRDPVLEEPGEPVGFADGLGAFDDGDDAALPGAGRGGPGSGALAGEPGGELEVVAL